jgi:ATP-dependent Clp protease ATP-binding subunit ClpA
MFERYTEQARRAIYFARVEAVLRGAPEISPAHLLLGLSWDEVSRANDIALLKDRLPELCMKMGTPFRPCCAIQADTKFEPGLDRDSKIALAYTAQEADKSWAYSIGTEHLLRGLLRFSNVASAALNACGIDLADARTTAGRCRENAPGEKEARIHRIRWYVLRGLRPVWVRMILMLVFCWLVLLMLGYFNERKRW